MAKQINLGKVKGTDATINGVTTLTITGSDGITASQSGTTLNLSAPTFASHASNTNNPHNVTKAQVGLGNVDNKSESTIIADAKTNIMTSANIATALGFTPADETALATKQNKLTGEPGQVVTFDTNGDPVAADNLNPIYGFEIDSLNPTPDGYAADYVTSENPAIIGKVRYIGANTGFKPAKMNFGSSAGSFDGSFDYGDWADAWFIKGIKPRLMSPYGTVVEELDPNDYSKKIDGSPSHIDTGEWVDNITDPSNPVTAYTANVMIGIPTVWVKLETTANGNIRAYFAPYQIDNTYHAWAHINDRGEIMPYTYIAAYDGYDEYNESLSLPHKMRSISGKYISEQTWVNQMSYCRANNGQDSNIWDMPVYADRQLITLLLILIGKSTNLQTVFGQGNINGGSANGVTYPACWPYSPTSKHFYTEQDIPRSTSDWSNVAVGNTVYVITDNSTGHDGKPYLYTVTGITDTTITYDAGQPLDWCSDYRGRLPCGTLNNKGLFYGYGFKGQSGFGVKVFGIENFWGNYWERTLGFITKASAITQGGHTYSRILLKLTKGNEDGSSASDFNLTGDGYIETGIIPRVAGDTDGANGYLRTLTANEYGIFPYRYGGDNASITTFYCDDVSFPSITGNNALPLLVGGTYKSGVNGGSRLYSIGSGAGPFEYAMGGTDSNYIYSSRLSLKP